MKTNIRYTRMTDEELERLATEDGDALAAEELAVRESCQWDERIAQACGRAEHQQPS